MFSKIKSLCKKFYKSRKSVTSFVLVMLLAFSAFMGTGIKSEAVKYATAKFYFNLSTISEVDLSEHKYFYVFKSTGSVTTLTRSLSNILIMIRLLRKHLVFYMVFRVLLVSCLIRHLSMLPHLVNIRYF